VTNLKIAPTPTASAMQALEPHVTRIYDRPGIRIMAIAELEHTERVQPAPNSDSEPVVKMKIVGIEVPNDDQENLIRTAQRALFLARTARGTFDEDGQFQLDEATLKLAGEQLLWLECARLRAGLGHWTTYAQRVVSQAATFSATEIAHELQAVADGLTSTLQQATPEKET
jgi:hypothetical protein